MAISKASRFARKIVQGCRRIIPRSEGEETITVKASLPNKDVNISKTKSFIYNAYYENGYQIDVENYTPVGAFTKFEKGILYITDGEEAVFTAKIKNENAAGKIDTNNLDWSVSGFGNNNDASTELSKAKDNIIYSKNSSRFDKAKKVFGNIKIVTKDDVHKNATDITCKPTTGVVYFTTEKDSSGQTFIKLSHNWDYYVDLPTDIISEDGSNTAWEKYKQDNIYNDKFLETLQDKNVDYWLISKEAYFLYKNKAVHFVKHPGQFGTENGISINSSWVLANKCDKNCGYGNTYGAVGVIGQTNYALWEHDHHDVLTQTMTLGYPNTAPISFDTFKYEAPKSSSNKDFEYATLPTSVKFVLKDCNPYVITTEELLNNYLLTIPDGKKKLRNSQELGDLDNREQWCNFSYISTLLHDGITPTVMKASKDENAAATTIGRGTLKIPYTNKKGDTGFIDVNVVFEKRLCEAYTNNWMKWSSSSSGYTHWYSNGGKLLKD